jgi:hypothetical protein
VVQVHGDVTLTDKAALGRQIHGGSGARYRKTSAPRLLAPQMAEARLATRFCLRARWVFAREPLATSRRTCR